MLGGCGLLAEHHVVPVHVRIEHRVRVVLVLLDFLVGELLGGASGNVGIVLLRQVEVGGVLVGVHCLTKVREAVHGHVAGVGNLGLALVTSLGGNEDDAVCTADTVHRRGGCVLEDREGLNLVGVDVVVVGGLDTVHHHKGFLGALSGSEGSHAADAQGGEVFTGLTASLNGKKAGETAGKHVTHVCLGRLHQFLGLDHGYGARHGFLLLLSEGHDDNLVQELCIFMHHHVVSVLGREGNGFRVETKEYNFQGFNPGRYTEGVLTVKVCQSSVRLSVERVTHSRTDDGFAAGVCNGTLDGPGRLGRCRYGRSYGEQR